MKNKITVFEAYRKSNPDSNFELQERKLFKDEKALVDYVSHRIADPMRKYGKDKVTHRFYTTEKLNRCDINIKPIEEEWAFTYNSYEIDTDGKPMNEEKLELLEVYKKIDGSEDFNLNGIQLFNDKNSLVKYLEALVNGWTDKFGKHEVVAKFYEDADNRVDVEVKPKNDEWAFIFNPLEFAA